VTRFKAAAQHSIYSTYMWEKYFSGGFGHLSPDGRSPDDDSSVALRSPAGPIARSPSNFHAKGMRLRVKRTRASGGGVCSLSSYSGVAVGGSSAPETGARLVLFGLVQGNRQGDAAVYDSTCSFPMQTGN
jgi:hypothetical protein